MITKPKIHIDLKQVESLAANGLTQEQIAAHWVLASQH
jgi:hypothetical protein